MKTPEELQEILNTIRALSTAQHLTQKEEEERRQLLFIGVLLGVGANNLPPFWVKNIHCGRTDRITAP